MTKDSTIKCAVSRLVPMPMPSVTNSVSKIGIYKRDTVNEFGKTAVGHLPSVDEEDCEMQGSGVPFVLHEPEGYLPLHQMDAIDGFNHLAHCQADVHERSTCLERYYGAHMRGTVWRKLKASC